MGMKCLQWSSSHQLIDIALYQSLTGHTENYPSVKVTSVPDVGRHSVLSKILLS